MTGECMKGFIGSAAARKGAAEHARPQVVVVGGGFGGVAAVRGLRRADVDVTVIDRHLYNTFNPLLFQVATASLNPGDITWFLRALRARQKNVRVLHGTVASMEHGSRTVHLNDGRCLEYDHLVIAAGVTTNFYDVPGAEQHSMPLYGRSQALAIRDKLFARLEELASLDGRSDELHMIVVGGGATGVETAGALAELRADALPTTHPEIDRGRLRITLLEMGPHLLDPFHPRMRSYAHRSLRRRGVDVRLGTTVKEVREDGVVVEHESETSFVAAGMVIWASGVRVHSVVRDWDVPQGRGGRIETDDQLQVSGLDGVYAIGDVAVGPTPLPQVAQPAIQGGKHVAKVISSKVAGRPAPSPFRYWDKGTMAMIGRWSAVAEIRFVPRMTGPAAWAAWILLHISMLLGNRNRFATLANLATRYAARGGRNVIVGETTSPLPIDRSRR